MIPRLGCWFIEKEVNWLRTMECSNYELMCLLEGSAELIDCFLLPLQMAFVLSFLLLIFLKFSHF